MRILLLLLIPFLSTKTNKLVETINPGDDPNFTIVENLDVNFKSFNKKVKVFNIPIYATSKVDDNRLLHVANIMAQYLDNDEDGSVDNYRVLEAMIAEKSFVVMWKTKKDLNKISPPQNMIGQDLGNDETILGWHTNGHLGRFDASIEEIWHIISNTGYAKAYPLVFGENRNTELTKAMDIARGGYYETIPKKYPNSAWYSYDDTTCDYTCMAAEYFYWALTSILGAQENRLTEIQDEWKLNTKALVKGKDIAIYSLLTNPQYKLPTRLPDGTYRH